MTSSRRKNPQLPRLALWTLLAVPIAGVFAQQAAGPSRPASAPAPRAGQAPATAEEWARTSQFMQQNAPQRFKVYLSSRDVPRKRDFQQFLVNRWRRLEELKTQSPELYEVRVNEIRLNDQVFGLCQTIKHTAGPQKQKLQEELKQKVTELFDNGLTERKLRIAQLEDRLKKQNQALDSDTRKREELIARRFRQISAQGVPGARLDNGKTPLIDPEDETIEAPLINEK